MRLLSHIIPFRDFAAIQDDSSMHAPHSLLQALLFCISICLHPSRSPSCHTTDPDTSSQTSITVGLLPSPPGGYGIEPILLAKHSYLRPNCPNFLFLPYLQFIFGVLYTLSCVTPLPNTSKSRLSPTFLSDVITTSDFRTPSLPVLRFYNCHSGPGAGGGYLFP